MTINTEKITAGPYTGNSVADTFSYSFPVTNKNQVAVYETDSDGVRTQLTVDTDYTVAGVGNSLGGTITRLDGALPTGSSWYIRSSYVVTQETDLNSQGGFFPEVHEAALDKLTLLLQQVQDTLGRTLRGPDSGPEGGVSALPDAVDRVAKFIGFDSSGDIQMVTASDILAGVPGPESQLVGLRTYALETTLIADDIQLGQYAIVEENEYSFYRITNLTPGLGDISLSSGLTATRDGRIGEADNVVNAASTVAEMQSAPWVTAELVGTSIATFQPLFEVWEVTTSVTTTPLQNGLYARRAGNGIPPLFAGTDRFVTFAHRGAERACPENTIPALNQSKGMHGVEFDAQLTSDGVWMLMHDETLDRTTDGSGNFRGFTQAQLELLDAGSWFGAEFTGTKIPTLEEAIRVCARHSLHPIVEIKNFGTVYTEANYQDMIDICDKYIRGKNYSIGAFSELELDVVREVDKRVNLVYFTVANGAYDISAAQRLAPCAIGTQRQSINQTIADAYTAAGVPSVMWTSRGADETEEAISLGLSSALVSSLEVKEL